MPESKFITSESMVDNHDLRNELITRTEVLDKVKKLLLIPEMNCMTIRQVADYYEVDVDTINHCCQRNRTEIEGDGVVSKTPKIFKEIFKWTSCPVKDGEISNKTNCPIKNFEQQHGIDLKKRGNRKTPYIQYIKDDEWDKVQKVIVAILEKYNVNVKEFFESCSPTFKEK